MVTFKQISVMLFEKHCMSTFESFLGSIDARTWRGYRLYGPRIGPIYNFILVTGSDSQSAQMPHTVA